MTRTSPGHNASATSGTHLSAESALSDLLRMNAQADPERKITTLRVIGEIDLATSPLLRSEAMHQLEQAPRRLILDLHRVDFLGSAGLAVLIELRSEALRRNIGLQLVTTSRAVLRPLVATGLIELFEVDAGDLPPASPRQAHDTSTAGQDSD